MKDTSIAQVYKDAGLKFDGSKALPADFLSQIPGYGTIQYWEFAGSSNYHSLQATAERRFTKGLTLGAAYTWSKAMGTARKRWRLHQPHLRSLLRLSGSLALTELTSWLSTMFGSSRSSDAGWETTGLRMASSTVGKLSGISQFMTGVPAEVGISIPNVNLGQRISGSYTEAPRVLVTGKPQSSAQIRRHGFDFTQFRLPDIGNVNPWPRSYLRRPGINVSDISVFKNFAMGADNNRRLQLRLEMFNAFQSPAV